ncbi:hypothetical protein SDC9_199179 [bioreactor metagenome]|uniref:4,5-DOPA dioxygenase extradiol n=1 Tax=bioreactor metagenome TaxID=1076179 RepID=A0A645IJR4_9ZZZZ
MVDWSKMNETGYAHEWASEAKEKINNFIIDNNQSSLINYRSNGRSFELAIPTPEHFLPLLYVLALKEKNEQATLFNDKAIAGSLTMTSVLIQ